MRAWTLVAAVVMIHASGCKELFPDPPATQSADLAGSDIPPPSVQDLGRDQPRISGLVCVLTDVRDFRSCAKQSIGRVRVTIEETGAYSIVDNESLFLLGLPGAMASVNLIVTDPLGTYAPSVSHLVLKASGVANVALPMVPASHQLIAAAQMGFTQDPLRGAVIGWAVDASATPQAGVRANELPGADGPFYDGLGAGEMDDQGPTRSRGMIAFFNLTPKLAKVMLSPSSAGLRSDQFELPIRAGAVTTILLPLPAQ